MNRRYFSTHRFKLAQILSAYSVFLDIALKNCLKLWFIQKYRCSFVRYIVVRRDSLDAQHLVLI
jgi:hypothetical protein